MSYLVEIEIDDKLLFLDNDLSWKFKGHNGVYEIDKKNYVMYILPLLEYDLEDIKTDVPNKYFESLPILKLLKFPFDNEMKYWAELAIEWVQIGTYQEDLLEWAKKTDVSWMDQKLKHRFWKVFDIKSYQYIPPPDGVSMP